MKKIFVSSVIKEFEEYRAAAESAIELMGHKPIMSEGFGARPYSSGVACISEVESSDIYLLIIGSEYGFITLDGISVTETEYQCARKLGKPILAFVQEVEKEEAQAHFQREVEDYQDGLFRASFSTPAGLKDEIIKALRQLQTMEQAVSEATFNKRIKKALNEIKGFSILDGPELALIWWPQPHRSIDIVDLENNLDSIFIEMCSRKLSVMSYGYEPLMKRNYTGIKSKRNIIALFDDGLIVLILDPTVKKEGYFLSSRYVPPSRIKELCSGAMKFFEGNSGWFHIGLENMDGICVNELPDHSETSITLPMLEETDESINKLFIPKTETSYNEWIEISVNRFKRIFSQ